MAIEAADRFKDKADRWRRLSGKKHPDNVNPAEPEAMRDETGKVYTCACCARMLLYTDDVYLMPTLTEVGFVAELVGGCCSDKYKPTIHDLRKQLEQEYRAVRRNQAKEARRAAL